MNQVVCSAHERALPIQSMTPALTQLAEEENDTLQDKLYEVEGRKRILEVEATQARAVRLSFAAMFSQLKRSRESESGERREGRVRGEEVKRATRVERGVTGTSRTP